MGGGVHRHTANVACGAKSKFLEGRGEALPPSSPVTVSTIPRPALGTIQSDFPH